MNTGFEFGSDPRLSGRIDAALRSAGEATPAPGLEGRILSRLAAERKQRSADPGALSGFLRSGFSRVGFTTFGRLSRFSAPALGCLGSLLVAALIVTGSVSHSRRNLPSQGPVAPALHLPGSGVGAAAAAHAAGPSSAPIPAEKSANGRSGHRSARGRARIAPRAKKAQGVVVPNPPSTPDN